MCLTELEARSLFVLGKRFENVSILEGGIDLWSIEVEKPFRV